MMGWLRAARALLTRPAGQTALASVLLAVALADHVGPALGPVLLASLAAALALLGARSTDGAGASPPFVHEAVRPLLLLVLAGFIGWSAARLRHDLPSLAVLGIAALALAIELPLDRKAAARSETKPWRLWLWIASGALLGVLGLRSSPDPGIDVFMFQQQAAGHLLSGRSPYAVAYPNIYGGLHFYSPAVADLAFVRAFPYPPLTVLAGIPAFVAGHDVRLTGLVMVLVSAWALSRLAPPGLGDLGAGLLLFHPRLRELETRAFTEPTVLALALLFILALLRLRRSPPRGWLTAGLCGGLLLASKQYAPLLLAPLVGALPRPVRARTLALALGLCLALAAPFAISDPRGFWNGVVAMQFAQPFRADSLSWPAALVRLGGAPWSPVVTAALALAALVATWPRRGGVPQATACAATSWLVTVLAAKQAFLNYHWLASMLLLAACLLQARGLVEGETAANAG